MGTRTMFIAAVATFLFFVSLVALSNQAETFTPAKPTATKSFVVSLEGSGTHTASLNVNGKAHSCTFSYATGKKAAPPPPPKAETKAEGPAAVVPVEQLIESLRDECIVKTIDYWQYKVCIGNSIVQSHGGDTYNLGSYLDTNDNHQNFEGGTYCNVIDSKRKSKLNFLCHATETGIVSVDEISTCSYSVAVYSPTFCKNPVFSTHTIQAVQAPPTQRSGPTADVSKYEDWKIEMYAGDDGRTVCVANRVGDRSNGPQFSTVNLHFDNQEPITGFVARKTNRGVIDPKQLAVSGARLTTSDTFEGKVEFVKIVT